MRFKKEALNKTEIFLKKDIFDRQIGNFWFVHGWYGTDQLGKDGQYLISITSFKELKDSYYTRIYFQLLTLCGGIHVWLLSTLGYNHRVFQAIYIFRKPFLQWLFCFESSTILCIAEDSGIYSSMHTCPCDLVWNNVCSLTLDTWKQSTATDNSCKEGWKLVTGATEVELGKAWVPHKRKTASSPTYHLISSANQKH